MSESDKLQALAVAGALWSELALLNLHGSDLTGVDSMLTMRRYARGLLHTLPEDLQDMVDVPLQQADALVERFGIQDDITH